LIFIHLVYLECFWLETDPHAQRFRRSNDLLGLNLFTNIYIILSLLSKSSCHSSFESTMSPTQTPKPRLQRLRASCDGCFLAKVKCSKARPICSRCLTCGTECKYSPSSRAGKPRADRQNSQPSITVGIPSEDIIIADPMVSPYMFNQQPIAAGSDGKGSPLFNYEMNWSTSSSSVNGSRQRSSSSNTTPSMTDESIMDPDNMGMHQNGDFFDPTFPWTPTTHPDISPGFPGENTLILPRSRSLGDVPQLHSSLAPWFDSHNTAMAFSDTHPDILTPPNSYFDASSSTTPDYTSPKHHPQPSVTCNCFTTCLQSLQALHNHSSPPHSPPTFDVVLTVNRKAVESCASMLACPKCISKPASGSNANTTAMLLATIIEKIMSFYQAACQNYFGTMHNGPRPLPLNLGCYQITNEDGMWFEMEILWRELRKLEELCARFRDVCGGEDEQRGVSGALMGHLSRNLMGTFEVLKMQQGGGGGDGGL
jgi:hypothetical protein